jgi:hypothetical protein
VPGHPHGQVDHAVTGGVGEERDPGTGQVARVGAGPARVSLGQAALAGPATVGRVAVAVLVHAVVADLCGARMHAGISVVAIVAAGLRRGVPVEVHVGETLGHVLIRDGQARTEQEREHGTSRGGTARAQYPRSPRPPRRGR